MKALEFIRSTAEIKIVQIPKPTLVEKPSSSQPNLLVKVVAAAIDRGLAMEFPKTEFPAGYAIHSTASPLYLGWHYSGIVEQAVARNDGNDIAVGTAVFGFLLYSSKQQQGSFSEYLLVNSRECAIKPESVSFEVAAASATESITALYALRDVAKLQPGASSVLICGASGGVGSAAIGIAKELGAAKVTAICSDREVQRVRDTFQPDVIVNRTTCAGGDPIKSCKEQFDIIFDCPGVFASYKYFGCLKPKGVFVSASPSLGCLLGMLYSLVTFSSKRVAMVFCKPVRSDFTLIGEWLANKDGALKIAIDSTFHVADMQKAIEQQAHGGKQGRVVIKVQDGWEKQHSDEPKKDK